MRASESEERFKGAFEGAPIGMILFTFTADRTRRRRRRSTEAMCEITGHAREHLESNSLRDVVHPDDVGTTQAAVERLASRRGGAPAVRDPLPARGRAHRLGLGEPLAAARRIRRARPRHRPGAGHHRAASAPPRSSPTRRCTIRSPASATGAACSPTSRSACNGATAERPLLLQLFDLDGFKAYNDTFGHPAGDSLLTRMAHGLQTDLAERASAYRMGGDEFCVLSLPDCADHEAIAGIAAAALTEHGEGFQVTASYGSVMLPAEAATATEALREADRRMYARKSLSSRSSAGRQSADVLLRILSERSHDLGVHLDEVTGPRRGGRRAPGAAGRGARAAAAGRLAARRRQGGHPRRDPRQAGPARRRGMGVHAPAHGDRRAHPVGGPRAGAGLEAGPLEPRAPRRQGLPRSAGRRGDPARLAHHRGLRRLRRDGVRSPLPQSARARGRRSPSCAGAPATSSTPRSSRCSARCCSRPSVGALIGLAQRLRCQKAISPAAGAATTLRQPAGPSRGSSSTEAPSSRARSVACDDLGHLDVGEPERAVGVALDDAAAELVAAQVEGEIGAVRVLDPLGVPAARTRRRSRAREAGRRCAARGGRRGWRGSCSCPTLLDRLRSPN